MLRNPGKSEEERSLALAKTRSFGDECAKPAGGGECTGEIDDRAREERENALESMEYHDRYGDIGIPDPEWCEHTGGYTHFPHRDEECSSENG